MHQKKDSSKTKGELRDRRGCRSRKYRNRTPRVVGRLTDGYTSR